jgi:hypothetical protein
MKKYIYITIALIAGLLVSSSIGCKTQCTVGVSYTHKDPNMKFEVKTLPFSGHSIVTDCCESKVFSK